MGFAGLSSHTVRDGDSLQSIAFAAYGDATKWRTIAEANGIDDPLRLRRGTVLSIPGTAD
jgi:nucleoid-associated protein YgaU